MKKQKTKREVDNFLKEVTDVCKKHGLSISHEDRHGNFKVERFNGYAQNWLMDATNHTGSEKQRDIF